MAKILIVDDDPTTRLILKKALQNAGHSVFVAKNGLDGLTQVKTLHPALVICDWMMPQMNGLDFCAAVKADRTLATTYIILLTRRGHVDDRVKGLDSGADEFLSKPIEVQELTARVRAGLRLHRLAQELKEANQKLIARNHLLESLSMTDRLTGLLNRRALDRTLPHLLRQTYSTQGDQDYLCIFMMDIDRFKQVNDLHGHLVGDVVLRAVAERLLGIAHPQSSLYRYGGEEFTCVAPGLSPTLALEYGESLRMAVASSAINIPDGKTLPVTLSIGGAIASQNNRFSDRELLLQADGALYQAKQAGRNCLQFSQPQTANRERL
ncbi:diguanylate cyclase [Oscillatoriales cyanobacterium LEGE 11467]|uniref:Diguanylate cyclase n=1 Tax=Zarconia navalis LEGE 11467 TaxID=1828826 RepID=A0A928Z8W4_9CYAN|nr:diguanylate cyclase [Zarconia navalis]MBE9041049.1 diguanylate cyclase [Zarconia navalis LEGE 11467]